MRKESFSDAHNARLPLCFGFSACILVLPQFAAAQPSIEPRREVARAAAFSAATDLVLLPVAVIDRKGATITGLTKDNFSIWEGKTPQPIASFNTQDVPCAVGIVFDTSGSMKELLRAAKDAVAGISEGFQPGG